MPDPTFLTGVIGAAAGALGAAAAYLTARREKQRDDDRDADELSASSVRSWTALAAAHDREITRLHQEMDRYRAESEQRLQRLRDEYEENLKAAGLRITELETEVAALRRALKGDP